MGSHQAVRKSPEVDPCLYGQLLFAKEAKELYGERVIFAAMALQQLDIYRGNKINLEPHLHCTRNSLKTDQTPK